MRQAAGKQGLRDVSVTQSGGQTSLRFTRAAASAASVALLFSTKRDSYPSGTGSQRTSIVSPAAPRRRSVRSPARGAARARHWSWRVSRWPAPGRTPRPG